MNCVKTRKLPAVKAIKYNSCSCSEIKDLWQVLHESFNLAQHQQVNVSLLEKIPDKMPTKWPPFLKKNSYHPSTNMR